MTVINGDAGLMGTTNPKFQYMQFIDAIGQQDVIFSFFNSLIFNKSQLNKTFYIAVYAYETTDLTINVIVKRINSTNDTTGNKTEVTALTLVEGLSQQYTLNKGQGKINFVFIPQKAENITVELIEIQGTIIFTLQK